VHLPINISNKRVVIAPLCWGLGHATRCIPIIKHLLKHNNQVAIASDGLALQLLQQEFPELKTWLLPPYDVKYKYKSMITNMVMQGPKVIKAITAEAIMADKIAAEWSANIIISDNRLKFRSSKTHNIYITHQLNIYAGNMISSAAATILHHKYYSKYDEIWVPDLQGAGALAGDLSQRQVDIPTTFIGPLSRFNKDKSTVPSIDLLVILSGPEPQRTLLEHKLIAIISAKVVQNVTLVRGTNDKLSIEIPDTATIVNLAGSAELEKLLHKSKHVICRAGYTSIMDLVALEKKATLIPTPGQTEQEYLAKLLDGKHGFNCIAQSEVSTLF